jgi:hypothetical protein
MKRILAFAVLMIIPMLAICQSFGPRSIYAQEGQVLNIDEAVKNTDPVTFPKAQIKTYFDQVEGKGYSRTGGRDERPSGQNAGCRSGKTNHSYPGEQTRQGIQW